MVGSQGLLEIDNSDTARQLKDQISSLQLQQKASKAQETSQYEQIRLLRDKSIMEYEQLFKENSGSAAMAVDLAESAYLQAKQTYREAEDTYDNLPIGSSSIVLSSAQLFALEQQMIQARKNLVIARNNASELTKEYYKSLIASYNYQLGLSDYYNSQQLQITIDYLQEKLASPSCLAPEAGTVLELYASSGEFVMENQPLAKISLDGKAKLQAFLLAEDTLGLQVGNIVHCQTANGKDFEAKISFISPVAQQTVSSIGLVETKCLVELEPTNLPQGIGVGFQTDITFDSIAVTDTISVPASAIILKNGKDAVYVVNKGKVAAINIVTSMRIGGRVQVIDGIDKNDIIITNPYTSKVKEGNRVTYQS